LFVPDTLPESLSQIVVVLWEPQDDINIGNAVRACKNFGVHDLRLVRPKEADPHQISISAPKAPEIIQNIGHHETFAEAVEDCVLTVATTARPRTGRQVVTEPRGAAATTVEATGEGKVAYVFGREDSGLPNEVVDRCHSIVTIPTDPDYSSLNLGQAVLLNMWEIFREATDAPEERPDLERVEANREHPPAEMGSIDRMIDTAERALHAIDFFKIDQTWHIIRSIRSVFLRADLDEREAAIWHGIFGEVLDAVGADKADEDDEVS